MSCVCLRPLCHPCSAASARSGNGSHDFKETISDALRIVTRCCPVPVGVYAAECLEPLRCEINDERKSGLYSAIFLTSLLWSLEASPKAYGSSLCYIVVTFIYKCTGKRAAGMPGEAVYIFALRSLECSPICSMRIDSLTIFLWKELSP